MNGTTADSGPQVRPVFMARVFYSFLALAALSAAISATGHWAGGRIALAGHSDSRAIHEIVLGNNVFSVPENMIRFEEARRSGVANRLDIYLHWPALDGYSEEHRHDFNHVDGSRNILFISFQKRLMSRDMSGRYYPIYTSLVDHRRRPGPAGLDIRPFLPNVGYLDEVLMVGWQDDAVEPFVARCLAGPLGVESLAPCERDLHVGEGLSLLYRFPEHLLSDWRSLDAALLSKIDTMLQTAR